MTRRPSAEAADRLTRYGLARLASGHSSRATKYRHLAEDGLGLGREELAVLAVLLLRGPQTPGELKARSDRMATIASLSDVERVLSVLVDRGYVRRPGAPSGAEGGSVRAAARGRWDTGECRRNRQRDRADHVRPDPARARGQPRRPRPTPTAPAAPPTAAAPTAPAGHPAQS